MSLPPSRFPIIGIGGSAGGIPAMEAFFAGLPKDPGAAFIIVTHLSPDRESLLHDVVGRFTALPVVVAEDNARIALNTVYVMPPNTILTVSDGRLKLRRPSPGSRERRPIDIFLAALADDQGEYAVAVILSGGDGDGTLGAKIVKERGGLTLAQTGDETGPSTPVMPRSAIASGVIDIAVPAGEMGERIVAFIRSFDTLSVLVEDGAKQADADLWKTRAEIYDILRNHSGHDFSGYKTKTFLRRIRRRMQVQQIDNLESYVQLLREDQGEADNLFRDLLINVTNFFRDFDAFAALETLVLPKLFENRNSSHVIRIWVPGCATGEEVYSLAILMREQLDEMASPPRVQIYATDIDEPALAVARAARYPETMLEGVSPERRERYFHHDGLGYVVTAEVRELCIFSPHSIIRDPPFSRMDMVSCRNLLIYFGPEVQNRVIPTFHYSLRPGGFLFLGTSESIGQHADLFVTVDKKNRIFKARDHVSPARRLPLPMGDPRIAGPDMPLAGSARSSTAFPLRQFVEAQVLQRYAPAHVVVDADGNVVYYSARTGKYLEPPAGAPSRQLLTMARKGLRADLRAALREAQGSNGKVVREHVIIDEDEIRVQPITLTVEPLAHRATAETLFLVLFDPAGPSRARTESEKRDHPLDETADLERELRDTRERLQSTIEEYETALEELKSSNEELVSVNQEAQSTNEELEASKEEMQSLNEELNTINTELIGKVDELDRLHTDLRNLFESTDIATVFLDRQLVIRNFTPAASSIFSLRAADIGRPLTELSNRLDYPQLRDHINTVFSSGEIVEHQLPRDGLRKHYLARIIPYRDSGGRIDGVIVNLLDVTTLADAEEHQQVLISELNHRVKNMLTVVISIANHTLEGARSPEDFNNGLIGRLHAMARAYALLSRTNWKEISLTELIREEADGFGRDRFILSGSDLQLQPQQGLSLGMVIHELATNAAKYGSLSVAAGAVHLGWSMRGDQITLFWNEQGGPPALQPAQQGFGLSLIRGEISYRLGGSVEIVFAPNGLQASLSFGLDNRKVPRLDA